MIYKIGAAFSRHSFSSSSISLNAQDGVNLTRIWWEGLTYKVTMLCNFNTVLKSKRNNTLLNIHF